MLLRLTRSLPNLAGFRLVASLAAGIEWWLFAPSSRRRVAAGLRAGAILVRHQVFQTAGVDPRLEADSFPRPIWSIQPKE